jgi:midasin (ATPase involved in ribosome maturation)
MYPEVVRGKSGLLTMNPVWFMGDALYTMSSILVQNFRKEINLINAKEEKR